eukprot:jgi/Ulvmu1/3337/UM155_0020.1
MSLCRACDVPDIIVKTLQVVIFYVPSWCLLSLPAASWGQVPSLPNARASSLTTGLQTAIWKIDCGRGRNACRHVHEINACLLNMLGGRDCISGIIRCYYFSARSTAGPSVS